MDPKTCQAESTSCWVRIVYLPKASWSVGPYQIFPMHFYSFVSVGLLSSTSELSGLKRLVILETSLFPENEKYKQLAMASIEKKSVKCLSTLSTCKRAPYKFYVGEMIELCIFATVGWIHCLKTDIFCPNWWQLIMNIVTFYSQTNEAVGPVFPCKINTI